jgi:DNA-directed RNA polymerase specialized sigma24 family protein
MVGWSKTVFGFSMNFVEVLYSVTVIFVAKIGDKGNNISEDFLAISDIAAEGESFALETINGFEELYSAGEILKELTPRERDMFVLRYYCGCSNKEIEKMLGLKDGAAAWRLQNIKRKIATIIRRCER